MVDKLTQAKQKLDKTNDLRHELSSMLSWHLDNIENLKQDKIDKREERQIALAHGENVSKLTNAINRIDSKIEESEDAITGIKQRKAGLESEINKLEQEVVRMELDVDKAKLWKVARKYNAKAKELSVIVREFWDLYDVLAREHFINGRRVHFRSGVSCDNFYEGALQKIPVLKISGETSNKDYFFRLYNYRNTERRARKEQEAEQVAESVEDLNELENVDDFEEIEDSGQES